MKYLDPKNDLTFKKVFGQHPHLLKSFLNALLPLDEGTHIESLEYLPAGLVPEIPLMKYSIVDVRCKDNLGRQFIVEMQMQWTTGFLQRVLFNASKAYISQLDQSFEYKTLQPVYALNLVNDVFEPEKKEYYHHYRIVNIADTNKRIEGLEFVFIELPKFKVQNISDKKLHVLWLRFLTEINENIAEAPDELTDSVEIKEALDTVRISTFNKAELAFYDKYWDSVRIEKTLKSESYAQGKREGKDEGIAEGKAEGIAEGRLEGEQMGVKKGLHLAAINAMKNGLPQSQVASLLGISIETCHKLKKLLDQYADKTEDHLHDLQCKLFEIIKYPETTSCFCPP